MDLSILFLLLFPFWCLDAKGGEVVILAALLSFYLELGVMNLFKC
jgi:hypothetical protein